MQQVKLNKASFCPSVNLVAGYNGSFSRFSLDGQSANGRTNDYYVGFSMSFDLFDGFTKQTQLKVSEIELDIAEMQTEDLKNSLKISLKNYVQSFEANRAKYEYAKKISALGESTLHYWVKKEQNGVISSIQLREFQKNILVNKRKELSVWLLAIQDYLEIQNLVYSKYKLEI